MLSFGTGLGAAGGAGLVTGTGLGPSKLLERGYMRIEAGGKK